MATRVSNLTLLFRDQLKTCNETLSKDLVVVETKQSEDEETSSSNKDKDQLAKLVVSLCSFQMPLHYPRFTKEEYEVMSEEELDRLLKLYGLPTDFEDLPYKKQFAIGAFLWETEVNTSTDKDESVNIDLAESSLMGLITAVKDFVYYIFDVLNE